MDESESGETERPDRGAWVTRLLRRENSAPPVAKRPAPPRPPQSPQDEIATYTAIVQGFVDNHPAERPLAGTVWKVGTMIATVDEDGKVVVTPDTSLHP